MMALEARASPGPHWVPTGHRTCPAQHFQGLALRRTAGNWALQTVQVGQAQPEAKASAPGGTTAQGPLRAALPPARPQAGASQAPSSPPGERAPRQSAPPPRPTPTEVRSRSRTGWPSPGILRHTRPQAVDASNRARAPRSHGPPSASPAQAWLCLPRPFRGPPALPEAPRWLPCSRLTHRCGVSQCSSPLATWPAKPVLAPAAVLASRCQAAERRCSFLPRWSPVPCPGTSAEHRRAWGWAGLAQADSLGNSTMSKPRRGLRAP